MAEMYADIGRLGEISYALMLLSDADKGKITPLRNRVQEMVKIVERNYSLAEFGYREKLGDIVTLLETCEAHLFGIAYLLFQLELEYQKTEKNVKGASDRVVAIRTSAMEPWEVDEMVSGMLEEQARQEEARREQAEREGPHYQSVEEYYDSKWFHIDRSNSHFTGYCVSPNLEINGGDGGSQGKLSGSCIDMQGVIVVLPENDYFNIRINYGYQILGGGLGVQLEGDSRPPEQSASASDNDWGGFDASVTGAGVRGGLGVQAGKTKVDLTGTVAAGAGGTLDGSTQYNPKTKEETTTINVAGGVLDKFGGTVNVTRPRADD